VDAGIDTGPIVAQSVVNVQDDDTVETLHERIKMPSARCSSTTWAGWSAMVTPSQNERSPSREQSNTAGKRVVRRALISVYDKAGLVVLAKGLHEAGVALVSTGSTAARIADSASL